MDPPGVIRPRLNRPGSVNHMLPSGPKAMSVGELEAMGSTYSWKVPPVEISPILSAACSANHRLPTPSEAMPDGRAEPVGMGNMVN